LSDLDRLLEACRRNEAALQDLRRTCRELQQRVNRLEISVARIITGVVVLWAALQFFYR